MDLKAIRNYLWIFWSLAGASLLVALLIFGLRASRDRADLAVMLKSEERARSAAEEELRTIRADYAEVASRSPIFDIFGPDFDELQIFNLGRSSLPEFDFGVCPSAQCLHFVFDGVNSRPKRPAAVVKITGDWGETLRLSGPIILNLPLIKSCSAFFRSRDVDLTIAILDDRASSLRVAVAAGPGTTTGQITTGQTPCPPE